MTLQVASLESGDVSVWGIHPVLWKKKAQTPTSLSSKAPRTRALTDADQKVTDLRGARTIIMPGFHAEEMIVQVILVVINSITISK
mgnify:FL=1